jgi:uncharacterized membrane protein YcaP (DUF421 family)
MAPLTLTMAMLFETADDLGIISMALRAFMIFVATLIFLRIAGRRSFGQKTAFDLCITVLLGAVLSRAIVGASAMMPTLAAGAVLVLAHRLLAMLAIRWPLLDRLINGAERMLVENGRKNDEQMRAGLVSERDIDEALRKKLGNASRQAILCAVLERNGEITIVPHLPK